MKTKKMNSKLKSKLLILLCFVIVLGLCSCGGNMTDESVKTELERLLPLSYELNEIFWGKGLPTQETESTDRMQPVTSDCKYKSTNDILDAASEVFSAAYLEEIKSAVFTDTDYTDARYVDIDGILKVDTAVKGFNVKGNVKLDSVKIKKQNRAMVVVTAEYEDGGNTEITLVLQDGKWYLDSPTY